MKSNQEWKQEQDVNRQAEAPMATAEKESHAIESASGYGKTVNYLRPLRLLQE